MYYWNRFMWGTAWANAVLEADIILKETKVLIKKIEKKLEEKK